MKLSLSNAGAAAVVLALVLGGIHCYMLFWIRTTLASCEQLLRTIAVLMAKGSNQLSEDQLKALFNIRVEKDKPEAEPGNVHIHFPPLARDE